MNFCAHENIGRIKFFIKNKIYHRISNLVVHSCWRIIFVLSVFELKNSKWFKSIFKWVLKRFGNKRRKKQTNKSKLPPPDSGLPRPSSFFPLPLLSPSSQRGRKPNSPARPKPARAQPGQPPPPPSSLLIRWQLDPASFSLWPHGPASQRYCSSSISTVTELDFGQVLNHPDFAGFAFPDTL